MKLRSFSKWAMLSFLVVAIALYAVVFALTDFNQSELKEKILQLPWTLQIHAVGGAIALLLGLIQFSRLGGNIPGKWHKFVGRIYAIAVFSSAVMGLVMAVRADGGLIAQIGFGLLAIAWLGTLVAALAAIYQKQIVVHQTFMSLNYALTWASVTLRVELPLLAMAFGFEIGYQMIAWLCWVPNLLLAGWWLHRKNQRLLKHA